MRCLDPISVILDVTKRGDLTGVWANNITVQDSQRSSVGSSTTMERGSTGKIKTNANRVPSNDSPQQTAQPTGRTVSALTTEEEVCSWSHRQCFFFSRKIGYVPQENIYFHYLKQSFLDQSIQ